ncbi:MAG TPA: vWA domain-containing protein [Methylococcus sp.]|nr:vWA domain-containing protein [Methylococcus sp.]
MKRWDSARIGVTLAFALAVAACFPWRLQQSRPVFRHLVIVDITRSMNVEDYRLGARPLSRLAFVKQALQRALADLPCGSRFGLGVFSERQVALLFAPIEVCSGFAAISGAIERLDWRMAWAADSRIAKGLHQALETFAGLDASLVFLTDGHEAPPVNPRYLPGFAELRGKATGWIVGVGGSGLSPIPKFDESGRRLGFYAEEEVPQRSSFGLPELPPDQIEGYHARNAPFGSEQFHGVEHLSSLKEDYLRQLAEASGLAYHRLEDARGLTEALLAPRLARRRDVAVDARWIPGLGALLLLVATYLSTVFAIPPDFSQRIGLAVFRRFASSIPRQERGEKR